MKYEYTAGSDVLVSIMKERAHLIADKHQIPTEIEFAPDAYENLDAQLIMYMKSTGYSIKEMLCGMKMSVNNRLESMHFTLSNCEGE